MEMTLRMTFSTLWTGLQRSDADSYMVGSSPGACNIEMQTLPSGYTVNRKGRMMDGRRHMSALTPVQAPARSNTLTVGVEQRWIELHLERG